MREGRLVQRTGSPIRERKGQRTYAWPFYAFTLDPPKAGRAGFLDFYQSQEMRNAKTRRCGHPGRPVPSISAFHSDQDPWPHPAQMVENLWHQLAQRVEGVVTGSQYQDCYR